MYNNPKHIKDNRVNSRYDDYEYDELMRWADATGHQKASFQRLATLKFMQDLKKEFNNQLESKEVAI